MALYVSLPFPDQHPAPREVAAHHHLELGSELWPLPGSLLAWEAVLLAGLVLLLALHSLPHSVVEVVVGMAIPVLLAVMVVLLAQGCSQEVNLNYIWNNIFCCKVSE